MTGKSIFWKNQAKEFKFDVKAVNFDPLAEELELYFLQSLIKDKTSVCDLGCGNGRTLLDLAAKKINSIFYGVDFIEEMIEVAQAKKQEMAISNADFYVGNAASKAIRSMFSSKFDTVFTKRLLINLKGRDKIRAIDNIHSILKNKGVYIMMECFTEPLERINGIRKALDLEEIKIKSFNEYLNSGFLKKIEDRFKINKQVDFGSLYYFISRIFNAFLSKGKPDYFASVNKLAVTLTKLGVNIKESYSPETIYILEKR